MFTGLIEDVGKITKIEKKSGGPVRISIITVLDLADTKIGDSIALNGACLTVIELAPPVFTAEVSAETFARTNFKNLRTNDKVNLERALSFSQRLGGHLVLGHVDGTGIVQDKMKGADYFRLIFTTEEETADYIVAKGSVAIDGVSMTVNEVKERRFSINVIPHTAGNTTLGLKNIGDRVNIETDIIARYVKKFIEQSGEKAKKQPGKINLQFLAEQGFI